VRGSSWEGIAGAGTRNSNAAACGPAEATHGGHRQRFVSLSFYQLLFGKIRKFKPYSQLSGAEHDSSTLLVVMFAALLAFDYKFYSGRLVDAISDQATQVGYWLNSELSNIERRIAPFR
jgi:hypothetical protein